MWDGGSPRRSREESHSLLRQNKPGHMRRGRGCACPQRARSPSARARHGHSGGLGRWSPSMGLQGFRPSLLATKPGPNPHFHLYPAVLFFHTKHLFFRHVPPRNSVTVHTPDGQAAFKPGPRSDSLLLFAGLSRQESDKEPEQGAAHFINKPRVSSASLCGTMAILGRI